MSTVLLVAPGAKPGGAERAMVGLARYLPAFGFQPIAVLLEDGPLRSWLEEINCPLHLIPAGRLREVGHSLRVVRELRDLMRSTQASVVISNMSKAHIYGGAAAAGLRTKALHWQQSIPGRSAIEVAASLVPASAVVCSSQDSLRAQRRIAPWRRTVKIPLGISLTEVVARRGTGEAVRASLGWETAEVVGIVGRLQPWKGQLDFLEAAALVAQRCPQARFLVVGGAILGSEGDYPQRLEGRAADLGIADRVHFAGHQADVYPWMDALDVVVHASHGEPFGLVVVEAMALGKPVVATSSGGPGEIIEDGLSGVLIPERDPATMADTITSLLEHPERAKDMGEAAGRRASAFSEERMADAFARLLRDLLGLTASTMAGPPQGPGVIGQLSDAVRPTPDTPAPAAGRPGSVRRTRS